MPLPTPEEIYQALIDNADWEETQDLAKAKALVTAANKFLLMTPAEQEDERSQIRFNHAYVEKLQKRAQAFIAMRERQSKGRGVKLLSAENFRD